MSFAAQCLQLERFTTKAVKGFAELACRDQLVARLDGHRPRDLYRRPLPARRWTGTSLPFRTVTSYPWHDQEGRLGCSIFRR